MPHVLNMAAPTAPFVFSENAGYCAYSTLDGTLKLWDTNTGRPKQEYVPSSHLSATCTCLSWAPKTREVDLESPRKRKKQRRSQIEKAVENLDLIALGTTSGTILLYSFAKGDLHTQLHRGHAHKVTDICWHPSGEVLYSCSLDQHIVRWDVATASVKHKWKADKAGVHSVALGPTEDHLLSAGRSIKLWNLSNYELLQTFNGHATEVIQLLPVPNFPGGSVSENGASSGPLSSASCPYFLSAANNDRLVHAWQTSKTDKTSLASFALTDVPVRMCISPQLHEQTILLCVTTRSGQVLIFEHVLNGRVKKPLNPKVKLQVATDSPETPLPIPLLGTCFAPDVESTLVFAYGSFLKPVFEKVLYRNLDSDTCLVRKDPNRTVLQVESSASKIQTPGVSQDLTVLTPGHMAPSGPLTEGQPAKRRRQKSASTEMTLDERLHAISIEKPKSTVPPKTDTLVTLLTQGLQSHDKKILTNVLQNSNPTVINNTVKKLPLPYIVPLVKELTKKLHGHAASGQTVVRWMKAVLMHHTSYLMSYPDLVETLGGVHQMMENRVSMFSRLSKLHGKLELMLTLITSQSTEGEEEEAAASSQPLLVYQDESSDEDIVGDAVESENEWDEDDDSEMEVAQDEGSDDDSDGEKMEEGEEVDSDSDSGAT